MKKLLSVLALGLVTATPTLAAETTLFGTAGAWSIMEHKKDCMTETVFADGTVLRIGLSDKGKKGYVAAFGPAFAEFNKHEKYPLSYDLDGTVFEVEGHGIKKDDLPGAQIKFEDANLLVDLALKHTLTMSVDGAVVTKLDLTGSDEAIKQMLACQEVQ